MVSQPGEHGSTYGGNPLACRVAVAALKVACVLWVARVVDSVYGVCDDDDYDY